jgi:hypothetical protein
MDWRMSFMIDRLHPGVPASCTRASSKRDCAPRHEVSGDINPPHFDDRFGSKAKDSLVVGGGALIMRTAVSYGH